MSDQVMTAGTVPTLTEAIYAKCLQGLVPRKRVWWRINVTGYGPFEYFGTELEAEDMRAAKAEWEGGRGTKRRATPGEAKAGRNHLHWQKNQGYGLDARELEALK